MHNLILCHEFGELVTVTGTLKGYDQLLNLVLDEAVEFLRGMLQSILETVYGFVELFICTNVYHPCTQELSIIAPESRAQCLVHSSILDDFEISLGVLVFSGCCHDKFCNFSVAVDDKLI